MENNNNLNSNSLNENTVNENNNIPNVNLQNSSPENNDKKSGKGRTIAIILIIILLVIVIALIILIYLKDNLSDTKTEEENLQYTLEIYKDSAGYYCSEKSDSCNNLAFTIKTETKDAEYLSIKENFILYKDNGMKLYNYETQKGQKINISSSEMYYNLVGNKQKIIGIIISKNSDGNDVYYNLEKNKYFYDSKYNRFDAINDKYLVGYKEDVQTLLSATEEKEVTDFISSLGECELGSYCNKEIKTGDKSFYILYYNSPDSSDIEETVAIYDTNEKFIATDIQSKLGYSIVNNYLYINQNNTIEKFDIDGNLIAIIEDIKNTKIEGIINEYAIYIDNNKLNIMNIDTKEKKEIDNFASSNYIDTYSTKYYSKNDLKELNETNKEAGIYIVVYYSDKDNLGNYGMEYCYQDNGEIKTYKITTPMGGRAKPVLYLYPTEKTKVKVEFEHPEYLTTTYPKYNAEWEVIANPNGDLYDKDNKYYYALYWDEKRYHEVDFEEGFYVTKENAITFLEQKLDIIGLNKKEKNEFIMYWLPILENNEKSLVYFELTEEREKGNKLIISPKPDSLLRVAIHIKKVNEKVNIKEEKLEPFKRNGFTAVEWGGMIY